MKIRQLSFVFSFFVLCSFAFADNLTIGNHIKSVLNDELVEALLRDTYEAQGGDHLDFVGLLRSGSQKRDGKARYNLLFKGVAGECSLTVAYDLVAKKVVKLTKEEIREALRDCIGF